MLQTPPESTEVRAALAACRARVAQFESSGNFDSAIEICGHAIRLFPAELELHQLLRTVGLTRKAAGGKPSGMLERALARIAKDRLSKLVLLEKLLARDPGNADDMINAFRVANRPGLTDVADWLAGLAAKATSSA